MTYEKHILEVSSMPLVSVVIPMYNSEKTIIRAINSVLEQSYRCKLEIIVVNDGSNDNSEEVVCKYISGNNLERLIFLINKANGGAASARNLGMENSRGDYIAFLDADDKWDKNKLEKQMTVFDIDKEIGLVGSNLNDQRFNYFFFKKFHHYTIIKLIDLIFKNFFQPSTVIIKREVIEKVGYFNNEQRYAEEGNYFLRIASQYKCILVNEGLVEFGDGKAGYGHSGLSANLVEMEKGELKNLRFAYHAKYISICTYYFAVSYSVIKYFRRVIFNEIRKLKT